MSWLKRLVFVAVVILIVAQVYRPSRTNPPVDPSREIAATGVMPPAVAAIFSRACNDCHSYRTVWPWYSAVAPVSWLVVYDVRAGRKKMNLSDWAGYDAQKESKLVDEACKEVREGEMPGTMYTLMHPQAKLTVGDVQAICAWTQTAH